MKAFLKKYRSILIAIPILFVLGNIFFPLAAIYYIGMLINYAQKRQDTHLIICLLVTFTLADNRWGYLNFIMPLRVIITVFLGLKTIKDLIDRKYKLSPLFFLVCIFYFLSIIGAFRNYSFATSFSKATSYFLLLFVSLHYFNYHFRKSGHILIKDIVYLGFLIFSIGMIMIFIRPSVAFYGFSGRFRGILGNPNGIGIYGALMVMIYFLYFQLRNHKESQTFKLIAWGVLLLSIFLSFSRGSYIASFLFVFCYYFYKGGRLKRIMLYLILIPIIGFISDINNVISIIEIFGLESELRVETFLDGSGRFLAWQWAWETFLQNKWIGRGFAFEELHFIYNMPDWLIWSGHQGGVHNSFLAFLMNVGIIGLTLISTIFFLWIKNIKARNIRMGIIIAAGFSAFFEPWLNSSLNAFTVHFFIVILLYIHLLPSSGKKRKLKTQ